MVIKQVEFIPLDGNKALVVLVSMAGQVENRVIEMPQEMPNSALIEAGNFINTHLARKNLKELARLLEALMQAKQASIDQLARQMAARGIAIWTGKNANQLGNFILRGQANLLDNITAMDQLEQIRLLFHQLEQQHQALNVLVTMQQADGVQIFIGSENQFFAEADCTTIIAPYRASTRTIIGAVGVIGPMCLDYARIIPMVNYTSMVITSMLVRRFS